MPSPRTMVRALQRAVAARGRGRRGYVAAARALGLLLVAGRPGWGAYVRGSVAASEPVPGVSDLDLVLVAAGGDRRAADRRRRTILRALPGVRRLVGVTVYEEGELAAAIAAPVPLHRGALLHRRPYLEDELWLRTRPGLYGPTAGWRRVAGRTALPEPPVRDAQGERVAAWLELQWWWRHAINACTDPSRAHVPALMAKLLAEPVRAWLWVERHERVGRAEALDRAAELEPEAVAAARRALRSALPPQADDLALQLGACARLTARVADVLAAAATAAGGRPVVLAGERGGDERPLADARALTIPPRPFERVVVTDGSLGAPRSVAAAAHGGHPYRAVRDGDLLLVPTDEVWGSGWLRTLQCPVTDPVTFALLGGGERAHFPELTGWSLPWLAARAVAEHDAWLAALAPERDGARGAALSGARAALLACTLAEGAPVLALDEPAVRAVWADMATAPLPDASAADLLAAARDLLAAARRLPAP